MNKKNKKISRRDRMFIEKKSGLLRRFAPRNDEQKKYPIGIECW
jgi:hypothetical protein